MYELKNCPVCGAEDIKMIGKIAAGDKTFAKYQCSCCDAEFSAYQKYQKEQAAKKQAASVAAGKPTATPSAPTAPAKPRGTVETLTHTPSVGSAPRTAPKAPAKATPKVEPVTAASASPSVSVPPTVNVAAAVYKKAINSTVSIVARNKDLLRSGTGTMISANGYFLTNAHVVMVLSSDHKTVLNVCEDIYGKSGKSTHRFAARLVYSDPSIDLALLKTDPDASLVPVTLEPRDAEPGEDVYAIGNSKGEGLCIVEGIVSDTHRRIAGNEYIMISAPVTNGNSGGPVFNVHGNLIGIVQSGRSDVSAMNYAIPVDVIQGFLKRAKQAEHCEF